MNVNRISSTQKERSQEQAPNQTFLTEPSLRESDGYFTVEGKVLLLPAAQWERIEQSWENPDPFTAHWQAEAVARALALRFDGERAYRVVNPRGKVLQVFWVKKILSVLQERQGGERLEHIPAGFDSPMLFEVLKDRRHRKRVFLSSLDPRELFSREQTVIASPQNRH